MNPSATLSMQSWSLALVWSQACRMLGLFHAPREGDDECFDRFGSRAAETCFMDSLAQ
jgi:hypothetical protein